HYLRDAIDDVVDVVGVGRRSDRSEVSQATLGCPDERAPPLFATDVLVAVSNDLAAVVEILGEREPATGQRAQVQCGAVGPPHVRVLVAGDRQSDLADYIASAVETVADRRRCASRQRKDTRRTSGTVRRVR